MKLAHGLGIKLVHKLQNCQILSTEKIKRKKQNDDF